jgi:hypothetical protein
MRNYRALAAQNELAMKSRAALACALLLAAAGIGACAGPKSALTVHPERVEEAPICTNCHDAERAPLDHGAGWLRSHGLAATRDQRFCEICHRASACADCHGPREEINPARKRGSRFDVDLPHRGDYLSQHQIDGRLNPASCFPCHGRRSDPSCRLCHL